MVITDQKEKKVFTTQITMPCRLGLHARTATRFILFAQQFRSAVHVRKGRLVVDGKSILGLLLLGATRNSKLVVEAEGDDAEMAIQAIEAYFLLKENCADERI